MKKELFSETAEALKDIPNGTILKTRRQTAEGGALTASVVLDGETVAEYDLSALDGPVTLTPEGTAYPLTIELTPEGVRIAESACPGQDCVHTGWISRAGGQIICLPNRLVISLAGDADPGFDAVTG